MATDDSKICDGLFSIDSCDRFDLHLGSYVKPPIQLRYITSKSSNIARILRHGIVDLLDSITKKSNYYAENDKIVLGNENRLYHSCQYATSRKEFNILSHEATNHLDTINIVISSLAPTIFYQLREDIGISNKTFRQSFSQHHLSDCTKTYKSGSLLYKTFDELYILKTLHEHQAHLLLHTLFGYHLRLRQCSTILNRYLGLYSVRIQTSISTITIYIAITTNIFTSSLKINEIFHLKGSTVKRKTKGNLSAEILYQLKDLDFMELYPNGIRIPTNIYLTLKKIITNDSKTLKKLRITGFSLLLGIRHLDMSQSELLGRHQITGVKALLKSIKSPLLHRTENPFLTASLSRSESELAPLSNSLLKPLEMLSEKIDMSLYYNNDPIANASLPIPGIINISNQRVYIYLALTNIVKVFNGLKQLDKTLQKLSGHNRHLQYAVIDPDDYEQRFNQFLFEQVFIDAKDDFPWPTPNLSAPVANINNETIENNVIDIDDHLISSDEEDSDVCVDYRF